MAEKGHVHKFQRHTYKTGSAIYFCVLDCNFKIATPLAIGKKSICWRCGNTFVMGEYSTRLAKPHCNACHKVKGVNQFTEEISGYQIPQLHPEPERSEGDLMSRMRAATTKNEDEEDI